VYAPSGAGGAGPYAFTFEILANTDIAVYKDDVLLTLTTHYTVSIAANGTGSVTITATGLALSPTSPTQYAIVGNRTISRTTDFTTGGDFFANTLNDELDQQTIFAQQNSEGLQRALTAPQTDPTTIDMTLPRATDRANKTLAFDANGDPTLGISAADVANAVTYATNAANSATAAAASASSASSSATSATSSASTATTQASNASTSASNASTSASAASTSATNAAASASTATTQASNASTSATNAASSASAASTSASNAATSATNASNSATTASTQASNAATSASNASTSATNAASSAAAAASALDSFDDRYLGTKTSDPTLDNDGNALVAGALYFSTTQNVMKVYDGASWITATSAGATSLLRFRYVATSGQTTFSGADSASATLTYTVNNIAVMRNGVTLDTSEYTASNGTSIVLTVAAGTGDIIDIIAFKSFTVADALSAVSGGTVNGAVTITGVTTVQAGSAAAPAITTSGDTNTGIFFPAADTIAFAEGGVEAMRIDSDGDVGIGTSSPTSRLHVVGAVSTTAVQLRGNSGANIVVDFAGGGNNFQDASNHIFRSVDGATERARIDSSGKVGIGTSSPALTLSLSGGTGTGPATSGTTQNGTFRIRTAANGVIDFGSLSSSGAGWIQATDQTSLAQNYDLLLNPNGGNLLVGKTAADTTTAGSAILPAYGGANIPAMSLAGASSSNSQLGYHQYSTSAAAFRFYVGYGGTVYATSTTITGISDQRLKENIRDLDDGLEKVLSLKPRKFDWKEGKGADIKNARGFIAQEFEIVFPDMVEEWKDPAPKGEDPYKAVNANLIPTLVKAIQELKALVDTQASTIQSLTTRITALENT
jgi:hypothetical protein